jgi:hypothetical protein
MDLVVALDVVSVVGLVVVGGDGDFMGTIGGKFNFS